MAVALVVEGRRAGHVDQAFEGGRLAAGEGAGDDREPAAHGGDAEVLDLEGDARMRRVESKRAVRQSLHRGIENCHRKSSFRAAIVECASNSSGEKLPRQVLSDQVLSNPPVRALLGLLLSYRSLTRELSARLLAHHG